MTGPVPPPPPPPPPGGPYGGPPPMGQPVPQSNTPMILGIVGIVLGVLCCPPAGLVLGFLSMNKAKAQGQPTTLGLIAIIVSAVSMVIGVIIGVSGGLSGMNG